MTANFTTSILGSTVTFTNTSTNVGFEEPDAYFWNFGDGSTSTQKNPVKTYAGEAAASTTYTVTLTTRNIWEQTANVTKSVTVAPLYNTGTLPVNELRVVRATSTSPSTPIMAYLRALRSDNANLSFNEITTRANQPNQIWAQSNNTVPPLSGTNLTRNPATSSGIYGLKFSSGTPTDFSLNTPISQTQNIASIRMLFDDKFPIVTYPSYEWDRYYLTLNDSFGGFYPVGYWDLPAIPNFAPRQSFGREYTMTSIRPMPPKIPYFKYTFNNRTVSFTSVETADSYAWTFGDGTTSTLKDPVKTYSAAGTYNVTLAVTTGGVITRTTTEPVIVEALLSYPVRYVKFAQKEHTGLNAWDTPYVSDITPICNRNQIQQTTPQSILSYSLQPISIAKSEGYSMEWYPGTVSPDQPGPTSPMNPLSTGDNRRPWVSAPGLRVKSLDGTFRTKWELVGDLGVAVSNINKFTAQFSRWSNYDGTPNPVCTGISYEVYVTDYVGLPSGIASATWTKIGEFNPTGMALNNNSFYTMTPL
jgi:PKD repeat protein